MSQTTSGRDGDSTTDTVTLQDNTEDTYGAGALAMHGLSEERVLTTAKQIAYTDHPFGEKLHGPPFTALFTEDLWSILDGRDRARYVQIALTAGREYVRDLDNQAQKTASDLSRKVEQALSVISEHARVTIDRAVAEHLTGPRD